MHPKNKEAEGPEAYGMVFAQLWKKARDQLYGTKHPEGAVSVTSYLTPFVSCFDSQLGHKLCLSLHPHRFQIRL